MMIERVWKWVAGMLVVSAGAAHGEVGLVDYDDLANSSWKTLPWCGYRFVFQPNIDNWGPDSPYERAGYEAEVQRLLTPVWSDPDYKNIHQVPGLHEWAWAGMEERWKGQDKRECYELAKAWYVRERDERVNHPHWKQKYPKDDKIPFASMTGHGWLVHGPAEWGADWLGIEIGENIIATQLHIAFLRGAARMYKLPTFADISQWYGGTVPSFISGIDETTQLPLDENKVLEQISKGGIGLHNGGHSSSSMARMWYVCWLSGITVVSPEACQATFFAHSEEYWKKPQPDSLLSYDKDTRVELSPYGKLAQKLYAISQKHTEIGIPYTPFAVLLDKYCGFFGFQHGSGKPWGVLPVGEGDQRMYDFFNTIFPDTMREGGTMEHERLVASLCGDTFDVLVTGVGNELLNMYPVVIIVGDHEFLPQTIDVLKSYLEAGGELYLTKFHIDQLGTAYAELQAAGMVRLFDNTNKIGRMDLLRDLRDNHLPVQVSGKVEYLINRMPTGLVIGLVNNEGVQKDRYSAARLDPSKKQMVKIRLKAGFMRSAEEWYEDTALPVRDNSVSIEVPAGEVRIVELRLSIPEEKRIK